MVGLSSFFATISLLFLAMQLRYREWYAFVSQYVRSSFPSLKHIPGVIRLIFEERGRLRDIEEFN